MRYRVLGPVQVMIDGSPARIGSAKQRALLAALLLEARQPLSTDRLIEVLWGEDHPPTALDSLRTYVYRLRDRLGDDGPRLLTRAEGYLLDVDDTQFDARRFEALLSDGRDHSAAPRHRLNMLEAALQLWRGTPFPELIDLPSARAEVLRLEELRREAEEDRLDLKLALGDHTEVVSDIAAFAAAHPLRERAQGQLMLALYRCGRQAEALTTYRAYRDRLAEELGLDPPPALADLERRILQRASSLDLVERPSEDHRPTDAMRPADPPAGRPRAGEPRRPLVRGLPRAANRLIGRDGEVAALTAALADQRLITIVGPGGVGKSRVAMEVARRVADRYPDGAWWCELAAIRQTADVEVAIATDLGVRPAESGSVVDAILAFLNERQALLVVDNAEHVVSAVEPLVCRIVDACPGVTVLVTGRTPTGAPSERLWRLAPLAVDGDEDEDEDGDEAGDEDEDGDGEGNPPAVELFLERARLVRADLAVDDADEQRRIVEICRRLDGLPLALELAASRLRALNPADLAARLEGRLDLVSKPEQGGGRHRALLATLDWSYGLLSVPEQQLFDRLSVFAGPFTVDAIEQVTSGDGIDQDEVLDLLTRLVDHSLVAVQTGGGPARYVLLQTLRTFGRHRLAERGEATSLRRRHAEYFTALAEDADTQVRSREELLGTRRLDRALPELRAAHRWTLQQGEVDLGLRLVAALLPYAMWRLRDEILTWAAPIAELPDASTHPCFPTVAGMAGWAAGLRGDLDLASHWAARGVEAATADHPERALVPEGVRMHVALWSGRLDACVAMGDRVVSLVDDPYDLIPRYVPVLALVYAGRREEALARMEDLQVRADRHGNPTMRSLVAYTRGEALLELDPPRALPVLRRSAELAASVDNRMVLGVVDVSLASLHARHGDPSASLDSFAAIIDRLHDGGDWTHLWTGLRGLAIVLGRLGQVEGSSVLLGAVREARTAPPVYGDDAARLDALEEELQQQMGAAAFADAYARGRGLTGGEAVELARTALATSSPDAREDPALRRP